MISDRFEVETEEKDVDVKRVIKILKEIKDLKDDFPLIKLSTRSNFEEILVSNIKELTNHSIQLKYEKTSWRIVDHNLPAISSELEKKTNLSDIVKTYTLLLENLEPFYSSLQLLDEICIIGEPEVITTKTNWRLVKFSANLFIKIEFLNPMNIEETSVTFHGATNIVKRMTEIYNTKCEDFESETIYSKLLKIFEIPYFPATDEELIDCSICLSYRCENDRCPIVCCDNEKCDATYHLSCLERYLKGQKHVSIMSICIGECPFCKQTLSNSYAPFFQKKIN